MRRICITSCISIVFSKEIKKKKTNSYIYLISYGLHFACSLDNKSRCGNDLILQLHPTNDADRPHGGRQGARHRRPCADCDASSHGG